MVSVLTFSIGVGIVKSWPNFTRQNVLIEARQEVGPVNEKPITVWTNKTDPCDFVRVGEKARVKRSINGGVLNSKACLVEPVYPKEAIKNLISGRVEVEVFIDGYGIVRFAKAVSGDFLLRKSAVEAAYKARISPPFLGGQPVNIRGLLIYNFVLPE